MNKFLGIWGGQTLSSFGSQMMTFALSLWVFDTTGSVVQFGLVIAIPMFVGIVFSPFVGIIVDKFNRRHIMIWSEVGLILAILPLLLLALNSMLAMLDVLLVIPFMAFFSLVHKLAYSASIPLLVDKKHYGKANGLVQMGLNGIAVIVPVIAVLVFENLGLTFILMFNILSFVAAILSLLFVRFNSVEIKEENHAAQAMNFGANLVFGMRYLWQKNVLFLLLLFVCSINFLNGIVMVLFRPMILLTESQETLGWMVSFAGLGGLAGAIVATYLASLKQKVSILQLSAFNAGVSMILCGALTNVYAITAVVVFFSFTVPISLVVAKTLWQSLVPIAYQGRVFSIRLLFTSITLALAVILAPWAAEHYFEPAMMTGGELAGVFGQFLGTGAGRGMGVILMASGILMLCFTGLSILSSKLKTLSHIDLNEDKSDEVKQPVEPIRA